MPVIDLALVEHFTGQSRLTTVEAAAVELEPLAVALERVGSNVHQLRARHRKLYLAHRRASTRYRIASFPAKMNVEGWVLGLCAATILSLVAPLLVIFTGHGGAIAIAIWIMLPYASIFSALPKVVLPAFA